MQKRHIRLAIILGFASILVLVTGLGGFSIYHLNSVSQDTHLLHNHPFTVSNAARNISYHITAMNSLMKSVVLSQDSSEQNSLISDIGVHEKKVVKEFQIIFERFLGKRDQIDDAYYQFMDWKPLRENVLSLVAQDKQKAAMVMTNEIEKSHVTKLNDMINGLVDFAYGKAEYFQGRAKENRDNSIFLVTIMSVVALCMTIAIIVAHVWLSRKDEELLVKSKKWADKLLQATPEATLVVDEAGMIIQVNLQVETLLGYKPDEVVKKSVNVLIPERFLHNHQGNIDRFFSNPSIRLIGQRGNLLARKKDGEEILVEISLNQAMVDGRNVAIATIRDISERHQYEQQIFHQANYDALTELPNRVLAMDRLNKMLEDARRTNNKVAVLFIDLDNFKFINDNWGHEMGDKCLIQAASRLSSGVRGGDTASRFGGDEFVLLLRDVKNLSDVYNLAKHILREFREPFRIVGKEFSLTATIGISIYPDDAKSVSDLLRMADTAMYKSKELGKNGCVFYTESLENDNMKRFELEERFLQDFDAGKVTLQYIPILGVLDKRIQGVQVLLSWGDPIDGVLAESDIVQFMERRNRTEDLIRFMCQQALNDLGSYLVQDAYPFTLYFDVSNVQLRNGGFAKEACRCFKNIPSSMTSVLLSISEASLMKDRGGLKKEVHGIMDEGVGLALTQFGRDLSSMKSLRDYHFSVLKLDEFVVAKMMVSAADMDFVRATVAMAHNMGIKVEAQGVSSEEQLRVLGDVLCDYASGSVIAEQMDAQNFRQFLKHHEAQKAS